jgi:hypothetical protein
MLEHVAMISVIECIGNNKDCMQYGRTGCTNSSVAHLAPRQWLCQ